MGGRAADFSLLAENALSFILELQAGLYSAADSQKADDDEDDDDGPPRRTTPPALPHNDLLTMRSSGPSRIVVPPSATVLGPEFALSGMLPSVKSALGGGVVGRVPCPHCLLAQSRIRSCNEAVKELSLAPNLHLLMIDICPSGKRGLNHPLAGGAKSCCIP